MVAAARFMYSLGSFKSSIFEAVIHSTAAADQVGWIKH
jgi:hypothetical protein